MTYSVEQQGRFWAIFNETQNRIVRSNIETREEAENWMAFFEDRDVDSEVEERDHDRHHRE
jgi:hypothetical protein